jgi:hypothetical protein
MATFFYDRFLKIVSGRWKRFDMTRYTMFSRVLKKVMSAGKTRQNSAKKRSLCVINEHFESNFNAVWPSAIVFQQPDKGILIFTVAGNHNQSATCVLR